MRKLWRHAYAYLVFSISLQSDIANYCLSRRIECFLTFSRIWVNGNHFDNIFFHFSTSLSFIRTLILKRFYCSTVLLSHLVRMRLHTWKCWIWRWTTYCDCILYDCVEQMTVWNSSHMQCSDTVSLQCGSSCVFSGLLTHWISCRSVNTCKVSLQCGSSGVFSDVLIDWISCCSVNTCKVSLQCVFSGVDSNLQL